MGIHTSAQTLAQVAIGQYNKDYGTSSNGAGNWVSTDPLFVIGNGSSATTRSDAMVVLKDARVGINMSNPIEMLHVNGNILSEQGLFGSNLEIINNSGNVLNTQGLNVGIGVINPSERLEVFGSIKATDYKYAASKTKYKAVSPMDFISGSNDYTVMLFGSLGASYMYLEGTTGTMAYAPIHLPNGAVVEEVTAYFYNNVSSNMYVNLIRTEHSTGASIALATANNTVQNTSDRSMTDSTIQNSTIDNENYRYQIRVGGLRSTSNQTETRIYSVRVKYSVSNPD